MLLYILLCLLLISISIHVRYIIVYIQKRQKKYFNLFLATALSNTIIALTLSIAAFFNPDQIRRLNLQFIIWLVSGVIAIALLIFKVVIFIRIYKRMKNPENYHKNFFGKKVYHSSVVKQNEYGALLLSMPFFLIAGAYFVARLINLIMSGKF